MVDEVPAMDGRRGALSFRVKRIGPIRPAGQIASSNWTSGPVQSDRTDTPNLENAVSVTECRGSARGFHPENGGVTRHSSRSKLRTVWDSNSETTAFCDPGTAASCTSKPRSFRPAANLGHFGWDCDRFGSRRRTPNVAALPHPGAPGRLREGICSRLRQEPPRTLAIGLRKHANSRGIRGVTGIGPQCAATGTTRAALVMRADFPLTVGRPS